MFILKRFSQLSRLATRSLLPGSVDEGRRIIQAPLLRNLIGKTMTDKGVQHVAFNAGAGGGLYSDLLLEIRDMRQIIEADLSYASYARKATDKRQSMVAASLVYIPLADHSVDLILCSEVLEHVWEDDLALDEFQRVLAPGGSLIISVPTPPAVYDPAHVREGYTAVELSRRLSVRGMKIIEIRYCMYAFFQVLLRALLTVHYRNALIWFLSWLDRTLPMGTPMNMIMWAYRPQFPDYCNDEQANKNEHAFHIL